MSPANDRTSQPSRLYLGILARPVSGGLYGEQNADFRNHIIVGRDNGVTVFIFGPGDVNWRSRYVRALTYSNKRRAWIRQRFPLPHVVWNRSYWPGSGNRARLHRTLRGLQQRGVVRFNPGVGTKWQVHELLRHDEAILPHIPHTVRYRDVPAVVALLRRYGGVYLKPLWGGWGIGVVRIRIQNNRYLISYAPHRTSPTRHINANYSQLRTILQRRIKEPYLVQQEIPLSRIDGRVSDIRVLAQRRSDGHWGITGMVVRVGRHGSVVSNLHGGGKALPMAEALQAIFPRNEAQQRRVHDSVEPLMKRILSRVEQRFGTFGEMGLDFGLDSNGHLWFIEVNSRPGRNSFRITSPRDEWIASSVHPVQYAKRLALHSLAAPSMSDRQQRRQ